MWPIYFSLLLVLQPLIVVSYTRFQLFSTSAINRDIYLFAKSSGKGFGKQNKIIEENVEIPTIDNSIASSSSTINEESQQPLRISKTSSQPIIPKDNNIDINANVNPSNIDDVIQNTDLFKKKRQSREYTLNENIKKLQEEEDLIATDPSVGAVPELVANRYVH